MSAPDTATPREVFLQLIDRISTGKWTELADLYAEDADVRIVFAPEEPRRLRGREALRERFELIGGSDVLRLRAENVHVHETDDPEVVIAEFDYGGLYPATGATFHVSNIQVLRVRDGLIVETRDFHDHGAMAAARAAG